MPYPNEHAFRINDPGKYKSFARQNDKGGPGIDFIFGITDDNKTELQAIRISNKMTFEEAKNWIAAHKFKPIDSEAASKKVMKLAVLNKVSFGYELAYALDSAKPREKDNLISAGIVKTNLELKESCYCICKSIEPVLMNKKYGLAMQDIEVIESTNQKPNNVRELLAIGQENNILKTDDETLSILKELKILKNIQILPSTELTATGEIIKAQMIPFEFTCILIKDEAKRLVYGVVYEPWDGNNLDAHGDYATADEIEKTAHNYLPKYSEVSLMHKKRINSQAEVVESFIAPIDYRINGELIKKGSWVMVTHVLDEKIWKSIVDGELNAYSIEGHGRQGPDLQKSDDGQMKLSKGNLVDMDIEAVALVTKGANKKKFYLLKSEQGANMNKELALLLLKEIQNPELKERILKALDEADRIEVEKAFPPEDKKPDEKKPKDEKKPDDEDMINKIVAKVLEKLKATKVEKEEDIQKYIDDPKLEIPEHLLAEVIKQLKIKE
jgi:hypothetical protein